MRATRSSIGAAFVGLLALPCCGMATPIAAAVGLGGRGKKSLRLGDSAVS
jgi:hypothetical protein